MKVSEKISLLIKKIESEKDAIIIPALNETLADLSQRIFFEGKDAKNTKIGKYSERGFSVNVPIDGVNNSKLRRKANKNGFAYIKGGTKELRALTGRQNKFVDLNFTGSLFESVKVVKTQNGFSLGIVRKNDAKKAQENEERFGKKIFALTEQETTDLKKNILLNVREVLGLEKQKGAKLKIK